MPAVKRWRHFAVRAGFLMVAALPSVAAAGSARDYLNAPVDSWLVSYGAGYSSSVTPEDGTDTVPGLRSNVLAQSLVVTRIMDFLGRTGGLSIVLPYALIDTSAGPFRANTSGFSDLGFLWQMNIFGGPALTREQFRAFVPQTFSSFHLLVTTPLGSYDPNSPINPSANRWMVSPTANFSYTPDEGWTWIETYVTAQFFSDNNNYLVNGAETLSQRSILRLEEHLSRNYRPTVAIGRCLLQRRRRNEPRRHPAGQQSKYVETGARARVQSLARRGSRAELRTRRRQTGE